MLSNKTIAKRLLPQIPVKLLLVLLLFLASLITFGFLIREVVIEKEEKIDSYLFSLFPGPASADTINTMELISYLGSGIFLLPAYLLIIAYTFRKRRFLLGIHIMIIAVSGYVLVYGLKLLFERSRPGSPLIETLKNYSFPSGHTVSAFIFCSIVVYLTFKSNLAVWWKSLILVGMVCLAFVVGISRVILQVHYPTDVIAGASVGMIWVMLGFWLLNKLKIKRISNK